MADPKQPPPVQAAARTPHTPPVAQDLQPPPASAQTPPPPAPAAEAESRPPPRDAEEAPPYRPPPPAAEAQQSTPPSIASMEPPGRGRKRPLECNFQIENSKYFKMRLILRDLRPHFLEVLRTPDFRNCKAAKEIQEKMKLLLEVYQQMTGETAKRENAPKSQSLPNGSVNNQTPQDTRTNSSEMRSFQTGNLSEKHQSVGSDGAGGPVVGGSAFGWNFVTYGGTEPVYCGTTKEEYRSSHPITEGETRCGLAEV